MVKTYRGSDRWGNVGYDKVLQQRHNAAERRGIRFLYDSETFICPTCGKEWMTLDEFSDDDGPAHPTECSIHDNDHEDYHIVPKPDTKLKGIKWFDVTSDTSSNLDEFYNELDFMPYETQSKCYVQRNKHFTAPTCIYTTPGLRLHGRVAWFYSKDPTYHYSHGAIHYETLPWPEELSAFLDDDVYNTALIQVYDGSRDLPYHKDDEKCYNLNNNPVRTVNLNGSATMCISGNKRTLLEKIRMEHGTIIDFPRTMQKDYYHAVRDPTPGRISITFRVQRRSTCATQCKFNSLEHEPTNDARVTTGDSRRFAGKDKVADAKLMEPKTTIQFGTFSAEVDGYYPALTQNLKPALPKIIPELSLPTPDHIYVGDIRLPIDLGKNEAASTIEVARKVAKAIDQRTVKSQPLLVRTAEKEVIGNIAVCKGDNVSVADAKIAKALLMGLMYNRTSNLFVCPSCSDTSVTCEPLLTEAHKSLCKVTSMRRAKLAGNMEVHVEQECIARMVTQQNSVAVPEVTLFAMTRDSGAFKTVELYMQEEEEHIIDSITLPLDPAEYDGHESSNSSSDNDDITFDPLQRKSRRKRVKRVPKVTKQRIIRAPVANVMCDVLLTALECQIPVEFVGKPSLTFTPIRVGRAYTVGVALKHTTSGDVWSGDDLIRRYETEPLINVASRTLRRLRHTDGYNGIIRDADITYGTSGAIIPWTWLSADVRVEGPIRDTLVIRGRNRVTNHIANAMNLQQDSLYHDYDQYSGDDKVPDDLAGLKPSNNLDTTDQPVPSSKPLINNELVKLQGVIGDQYIAEMRSPLYGIAQLLVNQIRYSTTTHEWGERGDYVRKFVEEFYESFPTTQIPANLRTRVTNGHTRITAWKALELTVNPDIMYARRAQQPMICTQPHVDCVYTTISGSRVASASCTTDQRGTQYVNKCMDPSPNTIRVRTNWDDILIELPLPHGKMYVPKDGYCYITLFLHMYLTIPDEHVKLFHRTVAERAIPSLGQWPTMRQVASWVLTLVAMFPALSTTPFPEILVHHESKTLHVPDALGVATGGYHRLNVITPFDMVAIATTVAKNGVQEYHVGGFAQDVKFTVAIMRDKRKLLNEIHLSPTWAFYALASPTLLKILYRSGAIQSTYEHVVMSSDNAIDLVLALNHLSERVSRGQALHDELRAWESNVQHVLDVAEEYLRTIANAPLQRWCADAQARLRCLGIDVDMEKNGFKSSQREHILKKESLLIESFVRLYTEQASSLEFIGMQCGMHSLKDLTRFSTEQPVEQPSERQSYKDWLCTTTERYVKMLCARANVTKHRTLRGCHNAFTTVCASVAYRATKIMLSVPFNWVNALNTYSLLIAAVNVMVLIQNYRRDRQKKAMYINNLETQSLIRHYFSHLEQYIVNYTPRDTPFEVVKARFDEEFPEYNVMFKDVYRERIQFQSSDEGKAMCKIFAGMILVMMVFDAARADLMYKSFTQVRGLFNTLYDSANPFSIIFQSNRASSSTMDVIIQEPKPQLPSSSVCTFDVWFRNCINQNNVIPVLPECDMLDFTRDEATSVVASISSSTKREFIIRGFVGSGKSTFLPHLLTKYGKVLLCEPVRVLASNVFDALSGTPFHQSPTLLMRGLTKFGSGKIVVATSGYAANYYNSCRHRLNEFAYIIFDEAHQHTAANFLLRSILDVIGYEGTILHVTATPIGREIPFRTMHPVTVVNISNLSFEDFASGQKRKVKHDVYGKGENVLVYVASYNDVDRLSNLLIDRQIKVRKVDARTVANVANITCDGTRDDPLYLVATNIIENGVTLNVDVVVDFGLSVKPCINTLQRRMDYTKSPITWGQRIQRNGRVGRYKEGYCLNINDVHRTPPIISEEIALETAMLCFASNVPPIFDNVDSALFAKVTRAQVQTAQMFELPLYITIPLVSDTGAIQQDIYHVLKKFLLREGSIPITPDITYLSTAAAWRTLGEYFPDMPEGDVLRHEKVPFFIREFGENSYRQLAEAIRKARSKSLGARGKLYGDVSATALILQTDPGALDRSITIVETELIAQRAKLEDLNHHVHESSGMFQRYTAQLSQCLRGRYQTDQIQSNIDILSNMRSVLAGYRQVIEDVDADKMPSFVENNRDITMIIDFQSDTTKGDGFLKHGVRGVYNYTRIASDALSMIVVACVVMYYVISYFLREMKHSISFEASGGRRNRLHLRDNKLMKGGYMWSGPSDDLANEFGPEYALKRDKFSEKKTRRHIQANSKPRTNMGVKLAPFQVFYGFDVSDYDVLELFDPITGLKVEVDPKATAQEITEEVNDVPFDTMNWANTHMPEKVQATFTKKGGANRDEVLKQVRVDMTTHKPTMVTGSGGIMGYPEHKGEFRQTGQPNFEIQPEGRSAVKSGHNIAPFISALGTLKSHYVNGDYDTLSCAQIGNKLIVNAHAFMQPIKKQELILTHGVYELPNSGTINFKHVPGIDMVIQTLPMDVPLSRQIKAYRGPIPGEIIRLLKVERAIKRNTTKLSDPGTAKPGPGLIWYHNIDTIKGDCGSLVLAEKDNKIIGIHTGNYREGKVNVFAPITADAIRFIETYTPGEINDWVFKPELLDIGPGNRAVEYQATNPFPIAKNLIDGIVFQCKTEQSHEPVFPNHLKRKYWVASDLPQNITYECDMPTFFNTRHTYEGQSQPFMDFLKEDTLAQDFFAPLLNHYIPSNLNGEAFKKDFFKYGKPVTVGCVHAESFRKASRRVIARFERVGYKKGEIPFELNPQVIRDDLNKHAAMGAQYVGKKEQHLETTNDQQFELEFAASCYRLANNLDGVWKGSLKAELRAKEKVQQNKTRVFTSAPYDVLLAGKACVMHFNKKFYANNTNGPWTVGINKLSRGWHKLLMSLPDGFVYGTGDGSQFDSSLTPLLINEVCRIRKYFMEDDPLGQAMLNGLYRQIIWTLISMPDGSVVRKAKGNPSGQPSTVDDNTMMVMIAVEYVFAYLGIEQLEMDKIFKYYANGDDLIFAVHPDHEHILNEFTHLFAHLGLNYIFEDRTRERGDLEYMSLIGIDRGGVYIPKLSRERISSIVQWRRKGDTRAMFDALNAAILESWGYDDLTYWLRKYYEWLIVNHYDVDITDGGVLPYHTETAVETLYMSDDGTTTYDGRYDFSAPMDVSGGVFIIDFQSTTGTDTPPLDTRQPNPSTIQSTQPIAPGGGAPTAPPLQQQGNQGIMSAQQQQQNMPRSTASQTLAPLLTPVQELIPFGTFGTTQNQQPTFTDSTVAPARVRGKQASDTSDLSRIRELRASSSQHNVRDGDDLAPPNQSTPGEGDHFEALVLPDVPLGKRKGAGAKLKGKPLITQTQIFNYRPAFGSIHNNKATDIELAAWQKQIADYFEMEDVSTLILGFMAYVIENGTSPEIFTNQKFVMANPDGEQKEYPLAPFRTRSVELRKIMRRFSQDAIDYIQIQRDQNPQYIPRQAVVRNVKRAIYYPYCFDFIDETTLTPDALEVVHQMKAAALESASSKVLGLDGGSSRAIDTERHTTEDVTARTHNMRGTMVPV